MLALRTLLILLLGVECFLPPKSRFGRDGGLSLWLGVSTSLTLNVADDGGGGGGSMGRAENLRGFDMDFAEAMSKPLPEWYNAEKKRREALIKEIEENRERIMKEFRAKYEVTEQIKLEDISGKQQKLDARAARRKKSKQLSTPASLFRKFLGSSVKEKESEAEVEEAEEEETTKEKWEKFWEEEEKGTGFYLPGFFEVFPELQLKWPLWARKKDGSAVPCKRDEDCQFPQACCPHPIIPGDKFCCSGWSQRILVPAYARQQATSQTLTRDEQAEKNRRDAEEAAREGKGKRAWQPTDD